MALFRRQQKTATAVPVDQLNTQMVTAIQAFTSNLRDGEVATESAILGFPQLPTPSGGFATLPLALAIRTNWVFALADPKTGEKHIEYPLVEFNGYMLKPGAQFLIQFAATPELIRMCGFTALAASDLPMMMTETVANGFVAEMVDAWQAETGREFVNALVA